MRRWSVFLTTPRRLARSWLLWTIPLLTLSLEGEEVSGGGQCSLDKSEVLFMGRKTKKSTSGKSVNAFLVDVSSLATKQTFVCYKTATHGNQMAGRLIMELF